MIDEGHFEARIRARTDEVAVEPQLDNILHPNFDEKELKKAVRIAKGLPASPGAASGKVYFYAEDVIAKSSWH